MFIIFYGAEGSGKSTQAKMLAEKLRLPYLGSGDLVRDYAARDKGRLGDLCRQALSAGRYVADSEMLALWKTRLEEPDVQNGFIIDGFPRNHAQALFLTEKLGEANKRINHVFYLTVTETESVKRLLKRGRINPDGSLADSETRIKSRLRLYREQESDVLKFFRDKELLQEINGEQSIAAIHEDILKLIK